MRFPRFQFRLLTCLFLSMAAGFLLYLNFDPQVTSTKTYDSYRERVELKGWPFNSQKRVIRTLTKPHAPYLTDSIEEIMKFHEAGYAIFVFPSELHFYKMCAVGNLFLGLLFLTATAYSFEKMIAVYEKSKSTRPKLLLNIFK